MPRVLTAILVNLFFLLIPKAFVTFWAFDPHVTASVKLDQSRLDVIVSGFGSVLQALELVLASDDTRLRDLIGLRVMD